MNPATDRRTRHEVLAVGGPPGDNVDPLMRGRAVTTLGEGIVTANGRRIGATVGRILALGILAGLVLAPAPASADPAAPAGPAASQEAADEAVPLWRHAIYKTITNETMANVADVALFVAFFGATPATAAGFLAINLATHTTVYYAHEMAWGHLVPDVAEADQLENSIQKTISYRVVSAARHYALGSFFGGGAAVASLTYTVAAEAVDAAVYFSNETLWWAFGPKRAAP